MKEILITSIIGLLVSIGGIFLVKETQISKVFGGPTYIRSIQLATGASNGECLTTDGTDNSWGSCGTGSGAAYPFTPSTNFNQAASATTTQIWAQASPISFSASNTAHLNRATFASLFATIGSTTNSTTTNSTVTGNFIVEPLTSALTLTGTGGSFAEYTGTTCTSQVLSALSALGVGTCVDYVAPTRALTVAGTAGQITSSAGSQDLSADRTWTLSLPSHVIFPSSFNVTYSTSTHSTTTTTMAIPIGTSPLISSDGQCAIDSTSGQFKCDVGTETDVFVGERFPAFSYGTTTSWLGTTTIYLGPASLAQTWNTIRCDTSSFLGVSVYDGTNRMNYFIASSTIGTITLSSNNTFTAGEARRVDIGTSTAISGGASIGCVASYDIDAD